MDKTLWDGQYSALGAAQSALFVLGGAAQNATRAIELQYRRCGSICATLISCAPSDFESYARKHLTWCDKWRAERRSKSQSQAALRPA